MSWSIYQSGKAAAVIPVVKADAGRVKCLEPEETIKNAVAAIIETALAAFPDNVAVKIEAAGSQSSDASNPGNATNSLTLKIEPIYGFVE